MTDYKRARREMCVFKQIYEYKKIVLNFENLDYIIIPFEYVEKFSASLFTREIIEEYGDSLIEYFSEKRLIPYCLQSNSLLLEKSIVSLDSIKLFIGWFDTFFISMFIFSNFF